MRIRYSRIIWLMLVLCIFMCFLGCEDKNSISDTGGDMTSGKIQNSVTEEQTSEEQTTGGRDTPLKIACVGDSLTYGQASTDPTVNSYPAVLSRLAGNDFEVRNFGHWGRVMSEDHERSYNITDEYRESLRFGAEIVVICLGTNDASKVEMTEEAGKHFVRSALNLIDAYKNAGAEKIYLCMPPYNEDAHGRNLSKFIIPWLNEVAESADVTTIDLYGATYRKTEYLAEDRLHLNDSGYEYMAKLIYEAVCKNN